MLIHLKGDVKNDIIEFDLPQIYFKRGQSVAVAHVEIDWDKGQKRILSGELISTLVDKSPCNPKQQIYRLFKKMGSGYTCHSPTHFLEYKLQCLDLQSSVFKIHVYSQDKKRFFNCVKGVYLILRISDARVQYGPPAKAN